MNKEQSVLLDNWPYSKAKSALLRSAAIVMREKGPRSATLKNVSAKAGVTEPAIFRHFDGVEGLFQSLFEVVTLYFDHFQGFYSESGLVGLDRLEYAYQRIMATLKTDADYCYLLMQPDPIFREYPKLSAKLAELKQRDKASVMACVKEAKAKGQLVSNADPEAVAMSLVGATMLMITSWVNDSPSMDIEKEGKKIFASVRALVQHASYKPAAIVIPKATKTEVSEKKSPDKKAAAPKAAAPKAAAKTVKAQKAEPKAKAAPKAKAPAKKPAAKAKKSS